MMFNEAERELLIAAARDAGRREAEEENSRRIDEIASGVVAGVVLSVIGLIALFCFHVLP